MNIRIPLSGIFIFYDTISMYLKLGIWHIVSAAKNEVIVLLASHARASGAIRVGVGAALRFKRGVGEKRHFSLG
jgi:hypothetical protein